MLESIEDIMVLGFTHEVIKAKMSLMPLLHMCVTDQVGAAEQARVLVQVTAESECAACELCRACGVIGRARGLGKRGSGLEICSCFLRLICDP